MTTVPVTRPAVALSDVNPVGGAIPGTARLAMPMLEQDEVWRTEDGRVLTLDEMTTSHRANLLRWLERHATVLMVRHDEQLLTGPLGPMGTHARDGIERWLDDERYRSPLARLRETPFHRRLAALVALDPPAGLVEYDLEPPY